jgi:hypothetical protein
LAPSARSREAIAERTGVSVFTVAASSVNRSVQALSSFADLTTVCSCTDRPPRSEDHLSTADGFDLDCR